MGAKRPLRLVIYKSSLKFKNISVRRKESDKIKLTHNTEKRIFRFGKHGLAINLVDSPRSMAVMKEIEKHFGKDIVKLDTEVISTSNKWYRLFS